MDKHGIEAMQNVKKLHITKLHLLSVNSKMGGYKWKKK